MVGLGHFNLRTEKKWDNTHKTTTPKVNNGVVQAAVEEDSKSNDEGRETVLHSYAQLLKANGFINISVPGDAKIKNPKVLTGMRCLNLASNAYRLMTRLYPTQPDTTPVQFLLTRENE